MYSGKMISQVKYALNVAERDQTFDGIGKTGDFSGAYPIFFLRYKLPRN